VNARWILSKSYVAYAPGSTPKRVWEGYLGHLAAAE
jgi:hypothetical protein